MFMLLPNLIRGGGNGSNSENKTPRNVQVHNNYTVLLIKNMEIYFDLDMFKKLSSTNKNSLIKKITNHAAIMQQFD